MRTFALLPALALGLLANAAFAADPNVELSDKLFITKAYEGGMIEVKLAEVAQHKSASVDVKTFSGQVVTGHSKSNAELKALAEAKGADLPKSTALMANDKAKTLEVKNGPDFDKAYAEAAVDSHKDAVKIFEKAANDAKDAEVKAFAAKTLPMLKGHLAMAEILQKKVGK